ncbi:uncharacterized protein LOC143179453 [Calliopsis andreniformis]|uniref:uncharacterized protein LOC143179453 n=1 Tax=Calliopsis andreniformis TaxID=337506 RepID=UPI003FCD1971
MTAKDSAWDTMLNIAEIQQQQYYELLPNWTVYKKKEYKYLKQNIGYALFGPPTESKDSNKSNATTVILTDNVSTDNSDITDAFHYNPKFQEMIDGIYDQICKFGEGVEKDTICYGLIYNVTFRCNHERCSVEHSKNKETLRKKENTENKRENSENKEENSENIKEVNENEKQEINIEVTPVFKIRRICRKTTKTTKCNLYDTWYIDVNGRVYANWEDYTTNNTLPKCTMVLPKNGFYQSNPNYEITEDFSKVYLEILDSPACSTSASVLKQIDTISTVASVVGLGLSIASLFTPAAPVTAGAAVTSGVSGLWTAGRSACNLIDKKGHKESITDRSAFCSWLAVTGSLVGIATSGGAAALTKAAESGKVVSKTAQKAYNMLLISNAGINGFGIVHQGYCMYELHEENEKINTLDILFLGTSILFLCNSVINFQSAEDLIKSTQGKVMDEYRANIRSKRLLKQYNRAKRAAFTNNTDVLAENAEVILYINRKKDLQMNINVSNIPTHSSVLFEGGKMLCQGIVLLDPMLFVQRLLSGQYNQENDDRFSSIDGNNDTDIIYKLRDLLLNLLIAYNSEENNKNTDAFNINEFDNIFNDMKSMDNATHIFNLLFKMAINLIRRSETDFESLFKGVYFLWCYIKENLIQMCSNVASSISNFKMQNKLLEIITALFEEMDEIIERLSPAFVKYISKCLRS